MRSSCWQGDIEEHETVPDYEEVTASLLRLMRTLTEISCRTERGQVLS